jgi:hypothetical protein
MSDRRVEPEDLGGLEGLPPDDPRVRDLESQPRARAQLRAYRDFVAPGDVPEGARVHEAEARLGEALERELGTPIGGASGAPSATPSRPQRGGGFLSMLFAPRLRPALALAALLVVTGGVWLVTATRQKPGGPIMRGTSPAPPEGGVAGSANTERLADGALRLTWTPSAEAESYAVVFLSPDLAEIARVSGVTEPHLDLRPGALPAGLAPGSRVLWRVHAMRGPDELARSHALMVTLP